MSSDDEFIRQQTRHKLHQITSSVGFYSEFLSNLKRDRILHPQQHEKYLKFDGGTSATFYSNYVTILTKDDPYSSSEAFETNRIVLLNRPENFIALCQSIDMCTNENGKNLIQAQQNIFQLEQILQNKKEMILAKMEIGAMYTHFGAEFFKHSIELYEGALSEVSQLPEEEKRDPYLYNTTMKVKLNLAKNLNKMMTPGPIEEYRPNNWLDYSTVYSRIKDLLSDVVETQKLSTEDCEQCQDTGEFERHKSAAWAELGYATEKYLKNSRKGKILSMEELPNPDVCFQNAMKTAPDTPCVLEKYGQYLRRSADSNKSMKIYEQTVALFQKALKLEPTRYLAAFELGRTFKSMWLLGKKANTNWRTTPQSDFCSNLQDDVEVPHQPIDPQLIPMPIGGPLSFKTIPNFDPVADGPANHYFSESLKYYEEAVKLNNNSCSLYLEELSRMYMSCNRSEEAKKCLDCAEQLNYNSAKFAAGIFEQLAVWYQNDICRSGSTESVESTKMAIRYFRKAIGYMVSCSRGTFRAFRTLGSLLYQETQQPANRHDNILQREYSIIYNAFALKSSTGSNNIINCLTHEKMLNDLLELIRLFHERGTDDDYSAAFQYIIILKKYNPVDFQIFFGIDKHLMLLEIAERVSKTWSYPENTFAMTWGWFSNLRVPNQDNVGTCVCLLGQRENQNTAKVLEILAICNIPVLTLSTDDSNFMEDVSFKDVQLCAIVIVKDMNPTEHPVLLNDMFDKIVDVNADFGTKPVCLASFGESDRIEFSKNYSTWAIPEGIGEMKVRQAVDCGFKLLRVILFG